MAPLRRLADEIPYRQFLKEGVVDLRDDGILKGYWLVGPSPDSCDAHDLMARSEQLGKSPVHFRTGDSIQIVFDRQPAPQPPKLDYGHPAARMVMAEIRERFAAEEHWITPTRLYLSTQFERPIKSLARQILHASAAPQVLDNHDLLREHALGRFQAFEDAVKGVVGLTTMSSPDMFQDLLHLITYHDYPAALPEPHVRLNQVLACEWQVNGLYPIINGWHLRPIVLTMYPSTILPQALSILLQHPGHLTLSLRYRCLSPYDAQKDLEKEKPFWRQTAVGGIIEIFKGFFGAKRGGDSDAFEQIEEINDAVAASQAGTSFGNTSCVAIVRDRDPQLADHRAHNLMGLLHGSGVMARIETFGAAKAIRTTWPGYLMMKRDEYEANRHKIKLTGHNLWDLGMPAGYWTGTPYIQSTMYPPRTPTPLVCSGTAGQPFFFPTHRRSVAHILGIGPTGSGKSAFIGTFVCALQSIPNAHITVLDLGRSSYVLSCLLEAEYHDVGDEDATPLCPLALLDQKHGLRWLIGWFERLFFRRKGFELDEKQSKDFMNALMDVRMRKNHGVVNERCRNLVDLYAALPGGEEGRNRIRRILDEMINSYEHIFGGEPTDTQSSRIVVYELSNLDNAPKYISTPAKELILYNTITRLDGKPAWVLWDEFWDAIGDDVSSAWFFRAIRTMRRRNCGFIGLTQSSVEITKSPDCNLLLGNMPGKMFFPDDSATTSYIAESLYKLGLNPHEVGRITGAQIGEFFYKSSIGARLASLWLGPVGQAICAATSEQEVEDMRTLIKESGSDNLLAKWLAHRGVSNEPDIPVGIAHRNIGSTNGLVHAEA